MKTKTAEEAHREVINILQAFELMCKGNRDTKMNAVILNVDFQDCVRLYHRFKNTRKQFFLPGEIGNENICFLYTPAPGCTIMIESEPCVNYRPKAFLICPQ